MAKKKKQQNIISSDELDKLIANENVEDFDVKDEIEDSMLSYAVMTIVERALPDIRDGLKPVHRRILWTCTQKGYDSNKPFIKNAKIAGDVMGDYHPHSSCYGTIANMSQDWKFRYPLIDFQGNNGSLDGDEPASERYTEGRLHKNAYAITENVKDKQCVDFRPNYSETTVEPKIMPSLMPNFLLNPSEGIAVGYTTKTPGHNLIEVCDALIYAIKHSDYKLEDLLKFIKGPDMPTGGILSKDGIKDLYSTGQQKLTFRASYVLENNKENNNPQIVFTSVTPDMDKPKTLELINDMINSKELPRVLEVRDESKGMDVRMVIECQPTANIPMIISDLYTKTNLQKNISFFMRGVLDNELKLVTLIDYVDIYLEHRRNVLNRQFKYNLETLNHKLMIQDGLGKVTKDIKKAINMIIDSDDVNAIKSNLKNEYSLNDEQVDYILERKISSLSKLDRDKIFALIADIQNDIKTFDTLLIDENKFNEYMINQLEELKTKYGDDRRTIIVDDFENGSVETVDMPENVILTLSTNYTITLYEEEEFKKFVDKGSYRERQNTFKQVLNCKRNSEIVVVFNNGEMERYFVSDLQYNNMKLVNAVNIFSYDTENTEEKVLIICKDATVKKISIDKVRFKRGKKSYIIDSNSEILKCFLIHDTEDDVINVLTRKGCIARFNANSFGTSSVGSKGMPTCGMDSDDELVDVVITSKAEETDNKLLAVYTYTDGNFGYKVIQLNDFLIKGRRAGALQLIYDKKLDKAKQLAIGKENFELLDYKNQKYVLKKFKVCNRMNQGNLFMNTIGENFGNLNIKH